MPPAIAKDLLKGAELAVDHELYRVAAANAYYAMFWGAQGGLRHVGIAHVERTHGALQQALMSHLIKKRGILSRPSGRGFREACDLRCDSHYGLDGVGAREACKGPRGERKPFGPKRLPSVEPMPFTHRMQDRTDPVSPKGLGSIEPVPFMHGTQEGARREGSPEGLG